MFKLVKDSKLRVGKKGFIVKFDEFYGCFAPEIIQCEVKRHDGFLVNKCIDRFSSDYDIKDEDIFLSLNDFNKIIAPLEKQRNRIIKKKELVKSIKLRKNKA